MRVMYSVLLLIAIALYFCFADHISIIFLLILIILPICLFLINIYVARKINVSIKINNKVVPNNGKIALQIHFDNPTIFPVILSKLSLRFQNNFSQEKETKTIMTAIPSNNVMMVETDMTVNHCGKILISANKLVSYDLLGLTAISKKLKIDDRIAVLPSLHSIETTVKVDTIQDIESHHYSTTQKGDDPSQVFDYHEYSQGDSVKNINWKLSSRLNTLMVKEFSQPISSSVLVLFEFAQTNESVKLQAIDTQFEVLMSVSHWLFEMQIVHQLEWYDMSSGSVKNVSIDDLDNIYMALDCMYEGNISAKPLTLNTYHENVDNRKYSNMIYITSLLDETMLEKLYVTAEDSNMSVLYINLQKDDFVTDYQILLQAHNIQLVEMTEETLQSDLQNISL